MASDTNTYNTQHHPQCILTGAAPSADAQRVDGGGHGGGRVEGQESVLTAAAPLLGLALPRVPAPQPRVPGPLPTVEPVVGAVALLLLRVVQGVQVA